MEVERYQMAEDFTRQLFNRLRYIEGQAQGVRRMLIGGRPGDEVLAQLRSLESAASGARELFVRFQITEGMRDELRAVVSGHLEHCPEGRDLQRWLASADEPAPKRRRRRVKAQSPAEEQGAEGDVH